jgi:hypothetical protein
MIVTLLTDRIEQFAGRIAAHRLLVQAQGGRVTPRCVARYLSSAHFLIRHTVPNLELAAEAAERRGLRELGAFYRQKTGEERGHELWARSDLSELSRRFGLNEAPGPCRAIEGLVAELEVTIVRDPASYLAYILFAEYFTVLMGPVWVRALAERCGVPPGALTVVSRHVDLDREHVAECRRQMEELVGFGDEQGLERMLAMAMARFVEFCDELAAELPRDERAA